MVFIMHAYRKNKALAIVLLVILFSFSEIGYARDNFVKIKHAELIVANEKATLLADLDFSLSSKAEEALHSGISLYWVVSIEFMQTKWSGLWYKTLFAQSNRYSLTYYTVLNNYRLKDEQAELFRRFSSLSEALAYMQHIVYADMPLQDYHQNECVIGVLKVTFDKAMLPAPLRPIAYFDKQWDLSADERRWCE